MIWYRDKNLFTSYQDTRDFIKVVISVKILISVLHLYPESFHSAGTQINKPQLWNFYTQFCADRSRCEIELTLNLLNWNIYGQFTFYVFSNVEEFLQLHGRIYETLNFCNVRFSFLRATLTYHIWYDFRFQKRETQNTSAKINTHNHLPEMRWKRKIKTGITGYNLQEQEIESKRRYSR